MKLNEQTVLSKQQPKYYKDLGYVILSRTIPTLNTDVQDVNGSYWRKKKQTVTPKTLPTNNGNLSMDPLLKINNRIKQDNGYYYMIGNFNKEPARMYFESNGNFVPIGEKDHKIKDATAKWFYIENQTGYVIQFKNQHILFKNGQESYGDGVYSPKSQFASCAQKFGDVKRTPNGIEFISYTNSKVYKGQTVFLYNNDTYKTSTGQNGKYGCTDTGKVQLYPTSTGTPTSASTTQTRVKPKWRQVNYSSDDILSGKAVLKVGDKGDIVKDLQQLLASQGGGLSSKTGNPDGYFGKRTLAAVKQFQGMLSLNQDGIVGKNVWETLINTNSENNTSVQQSNLNESLKKIIKGIFNKQKN
jgi:hypothetical protein